MIHGSKADQRQKSLNRCGGQLGVALGLQRGASCAAMLAHASWLKPGVAVAGALREGGDLLQLPRIANVGVLVGVFPLDDDHVVLD
jgi:hypothetical protein